MTITVNESILKKYELSFDEFFVLLLCVKEVKISEILSTLKQKNLIYTDLTHSTLGVTDSVTEELIDGIIIESDKKVISSDTDFENIAIKMAEMFPKGRKSGTNYYWRDSKEVISRKLKTLVAKFNFQFTEEQALRATREYVNSFNGNYEKMRLLKYFILKVDRTTGEIMSDFMSIIENYGQSDDDSFEPDWTVQLK